MRIDPISGSILLKLNTEAQAGKASETAQTAGQMPAHVDRVEVSAKAYEALAEDGRLTATSGKDVLEITRGRGENSFIIHFPDSAAVSRAVSRGFITVNGVKIDLPDDIKKQLMQTDKQAQADRDIAFNQYVMQHEFAVSQQQGEVIKKMADDAARAFAIATKLSRGAKVPPAEERELLEYNPHLYASSKMIAEMVKQRENHKDKGDEKALPKKEADQPSKGVDWSDFECKSYETRLALTLSDPVQFQGVSESIVVQE